MRRAAGFTLVEMLLAIAIAGGLLLVGYRLLGLGTRSAERAVQAEAAELAGRAFLRLGEELRRARAVTEVGPGELELVTRGEGSWRLRVEGRELVLVEAHGAGREVLVSGVEAITFQRASGPPYLEVELRVGPEGRARYATGVFLRGLLRAGGVP